MTRNLALAVALLIPGLSFAQMADHAGMSMTKTPAKSSMELTITGIGGKTKTLSPAEFKSLPHVTVSVMNTHAGKQESYSGVPVRDLLAMVEPTKGEGPKVSTNMQIVIAGATDNFHVAITLCDTNPECRNGQAVVADALDGAPLATDGAFKLILTDDKRPARWARNLESLTVKTASE